MTLKQAILDRYERSDLSLIVHDSYCYIYALPVICTCGLFHILQLYNANPDREELKMYEGWEDHQGQHWRRLHQLEDLEVPPPPTEEEIAVMDKMIDEMFKKGSPNGS